MEVTDFIPTKGSSMKKKPLVEFTAVTYESYKPKGKKNQSIPSKDSSTSDNPLTPQINMKKVKHEILKFGMSGFDTKRKEEAKVQLAIKLGAKPLKKEYKNYKKLMDEIKSNKKEVENINAFKQLGKNNSGKSTAKGKSFDKKRKKSKSDILGIYGKIKPSIAKKELSKQAIQRK